jgi:4-diphosphocytidyl-2-C-methyl-D-erythritol kinase
VASIGAPAKVNLRLEILAREESGFHQLETLFCRIDLADALTIVPGGDDLILEVSGDDVGPPAENLVYRAARLFFEATGIRPTARIHLEKRVPAAAGLGGGSSDAAATLRLLDRLHGEPLPPGELLRLAAALGSDVPFFLTGAPLALAWGRGDRLLPLPALPRRPLLLALPATRIPTPEAYRLLADHRQGRARTVPRQLELGALRSWNDIAASAANDFEAPVFRAFPELRTIRDALAAAGAAPALLSGSGSTVFGVFESDAALAAAAATLADRLPTVRLLPTATGTDASTQDRGSADPTAQETRGAP